MYTIGISDGRSICIWTLRISLVKEKIFNIFCVIQI